MWCLPHSLAGGVVVNNVKPCYRDGSCRLAPSLVLLWTVSGRNIKSVALTMTTNITHSLLFWRGEKDVQVMSQNNRSISDQWWYFDSIAIKKGRQVSVVWYKYLTCEYHGGDILTILVPLWLSFRFSPIRNRWTWKFLFFICLDWGCPEVCFNPETMKKWPKAKA